MKYGEYGYGTRIKIEYGKTVQPSLAYSANLARHLTRILARVFPAGKP